MATPAEARTRIEGVVANFERECRAAAQRGNSIESGMFGRIGIADWVRFQEIHTRHHVKQMPAGQRAAV